MPTGDVRALAGSQNEFRLRVGTSRRPTCRYSAEHGLTQPAVERLLQAGDCSAPLAAGLEAEALTRDASAFGRPELPQVLAEHQLAEHASATTSPTSFSPAAR